jgi:hypothetical protein
VLGKRDSSLDPMTEALPERSLGPWTAASVTRAAVISVAVTLIVWGAALTPWLTLSPAAGWPTIDPSCEVSGADLHCASPPRQRTASYDSAAAAWQELPIDYYVSRTAGASAFGASIPKWNPYIGSGFPTAFDGHNSRYSLSRLFLRVWAGEGGRDAWIVLRVGMWTFAIVLTVGLLGAGTLAQVAAALGAALAPHFSMRIDHVLLDVDALAPWFLVLLLIHLRDLARPWSLALGAIALGVLVGTFGFLQAQFCLLLATAIMAIAAAPATRGRSCLLALAVVSGFLAAWPAWHPVFRNIDNFVTSRSGESCVAAFDRYGLRTWLDDLRRAQAPLYCVGSLGGLAVVAAAARHLPWRFPSIAFVAAAALVVFGAPTLVCSLPGISGVRIARHFAPQAQGLFVVLAAWSADRIARSVPPRLWRFFGLAAIACLTLFGRDSRILWGSTAIAVGALAWFWRYPERLSPQAGAPWLAASCLLLVLPPFALENEYILGLFTEGLPPQVSPPAEHLDPSTPLGRIVALSVAEDRRHFSPHGIDYPNWSSVHGVLDLRILGALYPVRYYELNGAEGLFARWITDPDHVIRPDRFVGPARDTAMLDPDFVRLLIVNRVSLFTFRNGRAFPRDYPLRDDPLLGGNPGPYGPRTCGRVAVSRTMEAYRCPLVGGVGFFPGEVRRVETDRDALTVLRTAPLAELPGLAVVESDGREPIEGASGRVLAVHRSADLLGYDLDVDRAGLFVVADTWFPGWRATVNGAEATIAHANVAFKAVEVPVGNVALRLWFEPAE